MENDENTRRGTKEGSMKRVILESPFSGDESKNIDYARKALRHSLSLNEAPIASHLLYTQVLDDKIEDHRSLGIKAGLSWVGVADYGVAYLDLGLSRGMEQGISAMIEGGKPVSCRWLNGFDTGSTIYLISFLNKKHWDWFHKDDTIVIKAKEPQVCL